MLRYLLTLAVNCSCTSSHTLVSSWRQACLRLSHAAMKSTGAAHCVTGALAAVAAKSVRQSTRVQSTPACHEVCGRAEVLDLNFVAGFAMGSEVTSCRVFMQITWHALARCSCMSAESLLTGSSRTRGNQAGLLPSSRPRKPATKAQLVR